MPKTVLIISVSSDIGNFLSCQYIQRGWKVIGTYRQKQNIKNAENLDLIKLDMAKPQDIKSFISRLKRRGIRWDRLVCAVGTLLPAQDFFDCDFDQWQESVVINAIGPLRLLHGLYPLKNKNARAVFFAGGGANGTVLHLSAYAISKIILTKMTEFIDAESVDLHISIIGPGWTVTKIHDEILKGKNVARSKFVQTKNDLKARSSTTLEDIDACIEFVCSQPKAISSGRNFSVVFDPWRPQKRKALVAALKKDVNMYKLRRYRNDFGE